jgi:hypothetical protein
LPTWTPDALSSEARPLKGECWRLVEAQHRVSTLKLVDTLAEQALLEELLEEAKPPVPPECRGLHYLLATPFRYGAPYPRGSRFRRAGHTPGVYYASEHVETAVAEIAFHRLLFFADSPETPWPENAAEFTAFSIPYATGLALDLSEPPLKADRAAWTDPINYAACQALADNARAADVQVIRSESARDPDARANIALLTCLAFATTEPSVRQTWRLRLGPLGAQALCEFPELRQEFPADAFAADPRIAAMRWTR